MSTPTSAIAVNNPTDQVIITTTNVADYQNWFNVVYPLQIRWKSEDTSLLITGTGEPTVKSSRGSEGGLSTSTIVIITIVCALAVISAVISIVLWARQRKLKRQIALAPEIVQTHTIDGIQHESPSELHDQVVLIPFLFKLLDSQARITNNNNQKPVELPTFNMN